ncbi:MAG: acyl-[acyl-carrier-protein]--UDP-N-acetylglucosam ine O-acyltransferase [marine bacterium B5-7]|nr:MAG: acyl-[acyl-carrier-protein]--UDP-N-acetylglucosam ine O-acyltransferase [marine bacterium B5-7]
MIHASAIVDPGAEIAEGVEVGPFSIIEKGVRIGANTRVGPHVVIRENTRIGEDNRIFQFCSIGEEPQYVGLNEAVTTLEIGDRNIIREYSTLNRGTPVGGGVTRIGNDNFLMAYVHIAHDCILGDHVVFANCASLAGHVEIGDYVILGGFTLVHQFCRVGAHSITGIGSVCLKDVPPFVVAAGNTASPFGINVKGLRRRNFSSEQIQHLKWAYRQIFRSGLDIRSVVSRLEERLDECTDIQIFIDFLTSSQRGIIR